MLRDRILLLYYYQGVSFFSHLTVLIFVGVECCMLVYSSVSWVAPISIRWGWEGMFFVFVVFLFHLCSKNV